MNTETFKYCFRVDCADDGITGMRFQDGKIFFQILKSNGEIVLLQDEQYIYEGDIMTIVMTCKADKNKKFILKSVEGTAFPGLSHYVEPYIPYIIGMVIGSIGAYCYLQNKTSNCSNYCCN